MKCVRYLFFLLFCSVFGAGDITGFWKSLDDNGQPQCVFAIYSHDGVYYGRIIGTYNDEGKMVDTIYNPQSRAEGLPGNPHTCGLDIVYNLVDNGSRFVGKILDPSKGKTYNCEVWLENGYLVVRGKLFIFGKSIMWYPTQADDFPKGFKLPDMKTLTPEPPNT